MAARIENNWSDTLDLLGWMAGALGAYMHSAEAAS